MIELGEHAQFIVWGYIGVAIGTLALTAWVLWQSRRVTERLRELESRGIRRRSDGPAA